MYVYRGFALEDKKIKNPAFPCINFHSQHLQCHSTFCVEKEKKSGSKAEAYGSSLSVASFSQCRSMKICLHRTAAEISSEHRDCDV